MKILIVGNDEKIAVLTGKILIHNGYDTVSCPPGKEAMEKIMREKVCLVIAELDSDAAERADFAAEVKSMNDPPKLLFIGQSPDEESRMLSAGADDWIRKPYKTDVFLARVAALIRRYETGRKVMAEGGKEV